MGKQAKQGKQFNQISARATPLVIAAVTTEDRHVTGIIVPFSAATTYAYTALATRQQFMALCAGLDAR